MRTFASMMVVLLACRAMAEDAFVWNGPGCVLLKNGNVLLASNILPQSNLVSVRLDETGEVRVPNKDVVAIGRNPLELYQHQVSKTTRWGAGEHWHLAKWCLRQGLIEQSHAHYEQLKRMSGDHAKFKQLDSELRHALLQDPVMKEALRSAFPADDASSASNRSTDSTKTTSAGKSGSRPSPPSSSMTKDALPHPNATDRYSQDYFRQQLLPFLTMRCGQAGCHGAFGKSEFHVAKSGTLYGQRSADVSYTSAVRFIDQENIEATQLWLKATTAHGLQGAPSLTEKDAAERELLNRLRHWHQSLYRNRIAIAARTQADQAAAVIPRTPIPISAPDFPNPSMQALSTDAFSNAALSSKSSGPEGLLPEVGSELLALEREIAKLEEKERARKQPTRHDPEEFNRRYGSSSP